MGWKLHSPWRFRYRGRPTAATEYKSKSRVHRHYIMDSSCWNNGGQANENKHQIRINRCLSAADLAGGTVQRQYPDQAMRCEGHHPGMYVQFAQIPSRAVSHDRLCEPAELKAGTGEPSRLHQQKKLSGSSQTPGAGQLSVAQIIEAGRLTPTGGNSRTCPSS